MEKVIKMELLLIGAGYLARKIITQSPNSNIIAFRRQKNSQDLVDKATYKYTDIFRPENFLVTNVTRTFEGSVVVMLNPSTYPDNLVESVSKVARLFEQNLVKKIILVSSTGIFSDGCEKRIDNSYYQPIPVNKRAKKIQAIETEWCRQFKNVVVVRLGGLYCSERVVGLNSVLSDNMLDGNGEEYLNLIHSIDAARAILQLCSTHIYKGTFLLTDCNPAVRREYYSYIAKLYGAEPPTFSNSSRKTYACAAHDVWSSLGIFPRFPNYISGLA